MKETLEGDQKLNVYDIKRLAALRSYLAELRQAVIARRAGKPLAVEPAVADSCALGTLRLPNLAPYEAAKQNGTVSLLSTNQLRVYNRLALQREFMSLATQEWFHALSALESFDERYVDSPGSRIMGEVVTTPQLSTLSPAELTENQALIATLIKQTDVLAERFVHFDMQCRAVLAGAKEEGQLFNGVDTAPVSKTPPSPTDPY